MTELGNKVVNSVYECKVPEEVPRAQPKCDRYYTLWAQLHKSIVVKLIELYF